MSDYSGLQLSFCKEPFVYWKFGSRGGGQPESQLDSANYSYSKTNQGTNPFCSENGEKRRGMNLYL